MLELFTMILNWGLPPLGFKQNASFRAFANIFTDVSSLRKDFDHMQFGVYWISTQLLGPYLLMNLFSPIWTPECASSILGEHGRSWGTEEQHRELIISPIWFSLMTPHDQQPACRGGKVVQGEQRSRLCSTLTATLKQNVNSAVKGQTITTWNESTDPV